jgi:hypothetical protein
MTHLYSIRISARIIVANAIITGNFDSADFRQSSTTANSEPCCTSRRPIGPNRFSLSTNGGHDTTINLGDHDRITLATFSSRSAGKQFHHQLDRRYAASQARKSLNLGAAVFSFRCGQALTTARVAELIDRRPAFQNAGISVTWQSSCAVFERGGSWDVVGFDRGPSPVAGPFHEKFRTSMRTVFDPWC